ncbi:tyrosine-type recombinase/integrase [Rhizobiaceae bacterium n13]|uniref:tyrosine-type recombinase/integrase n=1 Tax=Ferirhizobium litorale TaxID=2927786 RepID=UPI0024B2EB57|nr:tyrosine-type recombinase/integrase [Fererhizobium litorale]MDI7862841.1 tyrosine-type recombinase/integrase [Fererhizobium litorale]
MTSHLNDFAIHDYQLHLKQALGRHDKTIDAALHHIRQFERLTDGCLFNRVDRETIIAYKQHLAASGNHKPQLSASTLVHSFGDLKAFFKWLSTQPGYRSMRRDLHEYFTPEKRLMKISNAPKEKRVPTKQDLSSMVEMMPVSALWERRDRAILAFLFLTGVRDGALVTLRLKHIDVERRLVIQDAREVATKASKTMRTVWFPVGDLFEQIVIDWISELRSSGGDGDAPLFPRTFQHRWPGSPQQAFEFLSSAAPVRKIVAAAADRAKVERFTPHAIRSTIAQMIPDWGATAEERKALSQNLGHEHYRTTEMYYGALVEGRLHELVQSIRQRGEISLHHDLLLPLSKAPENIRAGLLEMLKPYK